MLLHEQEEARIPATCLNQGEEHIEVLPPAEHGARLYFQVFCNGMPIGHARLEKQEPPTGAAADRVVSMLAARRFPTYNLKMIQITQNYRDRGIGTVLLKEILHYCRAHGIWRLTGEIKGEMPRLLQWYRRNGFQILDENWLELQLLS